MMKLIKAIYLAMALTVAPAGMMMAQNTSGHFLHTVTKGQSLYSISSMYNVPISDLKGFSYLPLTDTEQLSLTFSCMVSSES